MRSKLRVWGPSVGDVDIALQITVRNYTLNSKKPLYFVLFEYGDDWWQWRSQKFTNEGPKFLIENCRDPMKNSRISNRGSLRGSDT